MSAVQDTLTHQAFTPGPWAISAQGASIAAHPSVTLANGEQRWTTTRICSFSSSGNIEANARLIAAAPELYAALDLAYRGGMVDMAGSDFRDRVEAILAKVRGA